MDWQEDSSLHIIQQASSPWRKRSYDTYNDTNQPYYTNDAYSGYQVTDTGYNNLNGQPAQYATGANGNIAPEQPPRLIGSYIPRWISSIICGVVYLVCSSIELGGPILKEYIKETATVAIRVGDSTKRRLVEVTRTTFAPPPPRRRHHYDVLHRNRRSPIIRRVSPTSPGGRTHIPITPPRVRPRATLTETAIDDHRGITDDTPSSPTAAADNHQMSGIMHHQHLEPLMSGALLDMDMDQDVQPSLNASHSPYHLPGTYPYSPALPGPLSNESATSDEQASADLIVPIEVDTDELATPEEQAIIEFGTPQSEASDEPYTPEAQPTITFPLQPIDPRPRNYKGELLDEWQIKVCKEFQAIHPPPIDIRQQATIAPEQQKGLNPTGLIESHRSPLANGSPITPHQQYGTHTTGLIDSRRSPMVNVPGTEAADGTMDLHGSSTGPHHQPHGMTSTGLNDLHRSPLDLPKPTTEALHHPNAQTPIGLRDSNRSPLDTSKATTEGAEQPSRTTSIGLNDLHRSPSAEVSPTMARAIPIDQHDTASEITHSHPRIATIGSIDSPRSPLAGAFPAMAGVVPDDQHDTASEITHSHPRIATIGSIDSLQSPLVDTSPSNSSLGTDSIGSIDYTRSPLADVSLIHLQLGMNPSAAINQLGSPLSASSTESAFDAMAATQGTGPNISDHTGGTTPVPWRSPPISPVSSMTTVPTTSPSTWSIRSLYPRVQGKPKKRSPLCERINNGNIHKLPKTPKKVTWPEHGPVTATKRFIKNEAMSHPSPSSSREDSSILSSVPSDFSPQPSPTAQEEEGEAATLPPYHACPTGFADDDRNISHISSNESDVSGSVSTTEHTNKAPTHREEQTLNSSSSSDNDASVKSVGTPTKTAAADPSTPPSQLSPKLEQLTISSRRSSLRRREKEDQAQRRREAIAAEEKARKDKEEAEEKARKEKEEAEERARIKAEEEEEERKRSAGRRVPVEKVIQSLPPGWDEKLRINMAKGMREQLAMTSVGNPLTRRDFGMVLPQPGTGDDPSGWLNDEIISGYLQAVVDHGHRAMGHPRGAKPKMHAFNPFFYTTLRDRGYDAVKRWSSRAKIGGNDLKNVEYVFIPCNPSRSHWTLVLVSPVRKTIEVFDSMHGSSLDKVNTTKSWLKGELGRSYVDSEWTVLEDPERPGRGKGPVQNNANDCGVFAVTTAKMVVLGVDPMAVSAADMPMQRRRVVAELLNGGFSGEFEPRVVFE